MGFAWHSESFPAPKTSCIQTSQESPFVLNLVVQLFPPCCPRCHHLPSCHQPVLCRAPVTAECPSAHLAPAEPWPWRGEFFQEGATQNFPGSVCVSWLAPGEEMEGTMCCALYFWLQRHGVPCESLSMSCSPSGSISRCSTGLSERLECEEKGGITEPFSAADSPEEPWQCQL